MNELLDFDNAIENGIDWLESAQSWLSEENKDNEGGWKEVAIALEKLNAAMALLREVRTPLLPAIKGAQAEMDRYADMADAIYNR
jgi:hypothetical protein